MNGHSIVDSYQSVEDTGKTSLPRLTPMVSTRSSIWIRLRRFLADIVLAGITLIIWRIPVIGQLKPFAFGYLMAWKGRHKSVSHWGWLILAGWTLWEFSLDYERAVVRVIPFTAGLLIMSLPFRTKKRAFLWGTLTSVFCAVGLGYYLCHDTVGLVMDAGEYIVGAIVAMALIPGLTALQSNRTIRRVIRIEEQISLLTLLILIFLGMTGLKWGIFQAQGFLGTFILLVSAEFGRIPYASVIGIGFSLGRIWMGDAWLSPIFYGGFGLISGAGREYGRVGLFLAATVSLALYTWRKWDLNPADVYVLTSQWLAVALFFLIPGRWLVRAQERWFTPVVSEETSEQKHKLNSVLTDRFRDLAEVFDQLSMSFAPARQEPEPESAQPRDIYSMIEEISQNNCRQCTGYENCWGENFYATYREIFDLLALAEMYGQVTPKHLTGRLSKSCFQQFRLLSSINHRMERQKSSAFFQRQLEESRNFLSGQLQGVANIMSNLAQEIRINVDFQYELEDKLKQAFCRWGMTIRELSVLQMGRDRLEVRIEKRACGGGQECRFVIAPLVSRLLGQKFVVWEHECRHDASDSTCRCLLCPARKYGVYTAVCKKPSMGYQTSGDSHTFMEMKEGYFVSILSDGMGVGPKAAVESGATVSILEQLLRAGLNREFALQMVNTVILLRNQEETFATLDMALIDLYTAQTEFIKVGAAPTYIKSGKDVTVIRSTSLPVGVFTTVDAETSKIPLKVGDYVVMATDGVLEGRGSHNETEDWVYRALHKAEGATPEALGQYLLDMAIDGNPEGISDDVTLIVLQLYEESEATI
ncbi:MAG TPA: SpoIIE family protein phosphatase [Bacillota bacterium]|nr:SpoIIE family protein phosphatase [Bacillota bacterium]